MRLALSGERVTHHGKTLQPPLPASGGKVLKMMIPPEQRRIPIYLAGLGPQMLRLTGRVADGWLAAFFCPEYSSALLDQVRAGAAQVGRDLTGFEVCPTVSLWIDDDHSAARNRMRHSLALYVGGMGSRHHNVYADLIRAYGFGQSADEAQDLYLAGRKHEAAAALPEALIDLVTLCGPPGAVRDRLAGFAEAGVTTVLLSPATANAEHFIDQLRKISEIN
jgi:alkanesulfonate monooxygenase SsuD/methylene tetrahydromethanopterin reductase-like flavin-dependent oxidoreductase (luciferase family)